MIRAIVADDENATCVFIKNLIKRSMDYVELVGTASNGREAMEKIQTLKPDLVFLDINMPYFNGFQVIERSPEPKYIIITAYDQFSYAQQALRLGAVDIILKPIDIDQLEAAVKKAFGGRLTCNDMVNDILEYVHKHYKEDIKLKDLSEMFFITPSALSRTFKTSVGKNYLDYVHKLRIEEAKKLMLQGMSIANAADTVGYMNINNFYKHFKENEGMTPADFVKSSALLTGRK